jgi:hypothetical protein
MRAASLRRSARKHLKRLLCSIAVISSVASTACAVVGCSSVTSRVEDIKSSVEDGVVYYVPRRPIKVSITLAAAAAPPAPPPQGIPSVDTIDATADLKHRFILNYDQNWIGKNHLNIGVNTNGLLTTSNADTTSGITTIVQNLAKAIGSAQALAAAAAPVRAPQAPAGATPAPPCQPGRVYTMLLYPEDVGDTEEHLCNFSIHLMNLDGTKITSTPPPPDNKRAENLQSPESGIFYKHDLPYLVNVRDPNGGPTGPATSFIAFSPDLAPIAFVPVTRTLFSDNQTNITLSQGTVTAVDATASGELVALSELPADFISAYTTAIGGVFSQIGTNIKDQTAILQNQQALALATAQKQACTLALAANKAALDPSNIVGKTGNDLVTAVTNINNALSNIKIVCSSS